MGLFIQTHWRVPLFMWALLVIELPLTVALLTLFGIADPDLYRTKLWQEGHDHGFNSAPNEILYAYANHRPIKEPLPWSQFITTFNLVVSVLGMFIMLTKIAMFAVRAFIPLLSLVTHMLLVALFAYSAYGQSASDYSDSDYPSKTPWYLKHSCNISSTERIKGYCEQAKASFAVTVAMLVLFALHIPYSVWSMFPTRAQKLKRQSAAASMSPHGKEKRIFTHDAAGDEENQWEFQQVPRTPGTANAIKSPVAPYTPRTQAFQNLGGSGPLHSPYSPHQGYTENHSGGALPLRERYGDAV